MFAARGIAISFSVFVMVYCAMSVAVSLVWQHAWHYSQPHPARRAADLLFGLRMFPLLSAAVITAAFTVPSFLLLEPRSIVEPVGEIAVILGLCGAGLAVFGLSNAGVALWRAWRTISVWTQGAQRVDMAAPVPVLRVPGAVPTMAAAGIVRPKVFLSDPAQLLLTFKEREAALHHELAHLRRRDNLKKLALCFVTFPGMRNLERVWLEATEMAADEAAVANAEEALDLASALIKLARFSSAEAPADLTAALVAGAASAVDARVKRLISWTCERPAPSRKYSLWGGFLAALAAIGVFAFTYSQLLIRVHTATEWLVR
jgi:beta-lactamase regulating signal transducer with metallopeptidase domain